MLGDRVRVDSVVSGCEPTGGSWGGAAVSSEKKEDAHFPCLCQPPALYLHFFYQLRLYFFFFNFFFFYVGG